MKIGVYPGTFDPVTGGHADIIRRASDCIVDRLVIGVAAHSQKDALFTIDERVALVEKTVADMPKPLATRISVAPMDGLLIDFAHAHDARIIIRGLRAVSDFEYEFQMTAMNRRLEDSIETIFLTASEAHHFVSSRFVKEVAKLGGDVSSFVHPSIVPLLKNKFA